MKCSRLHVGACLVAFLTMGSAVSPTEQPVLPIEDQIPLFVKILSYDKNLPMRGNDIVIGVVYQPRSPASTRTADAALTGINASSYSIQGRSIRAVPLPLDDPVHLGQAILQHQVDVLYVAPLRPTSAYEIAAISRHHRLLTLTGTPSYVRSGLSVSATVEDDTPTILINLRASREEGAMFHSLLLKLAKVI